jgi:LuxR family quorum sensing-dependent transcriptional regulator
MERIRDAARIARSLALSSSAEEIWSTIKTFAAPFGFNHLSVMKRHPDLPHALMPSLVYIDAPDGFAADFDRDRLCPDHPLIVQALKQLAPFSAGEMRASQLGDRQRRVLQHVSLSLNIRDGWTFPISYDDEMHGIVMLGGLEPDMSPLVCSILHLLSHTGFKRYQELAAGGGSKSRVLTPRELECMRWVALGKTDEEIGIILTISARTARFHVENAKRKLGVATRVQAVAEALRSETIAA